MLLGNSSCSDGSLDQGEKMSMRRYVSVLGSLLIIGSVLVGPVAHAQQSAPDNTKTNQGDANKGATTADQQKMNPADRETTKKIRSALMNDKSLSTYAHNIKIITRDGMVTLKGPVRSEDEKSAIEAKAQKIAGDSNVTSELTVASPKQ
jgi:hyperosmotically inducible periplasmic protein